MSYFSSGKNERDVRAANGAGNHESAPGVAAKPAPDQASTLGRGVMVTGNIVCAGSLQIFGDVVGDIHAGRLVVCEGAKIEGKIVAAEAVIQGSFKGSIHGNSVKLQNTAVVEGEIYNKSLAIEQDARFEGVARRLERPVEPPSNPRKNGEMPARVDPAAIPVAVQ